VEELSLTEKTELQEMEGIIEPGLRTFYQVGCALATIRDSRLYRETHATFEEYCKDRWDMRQAHAYRLIDSASVQDVLSPIGDIQPANEAQIRPLTKLETAEAQQEAWEMVIETAPEGKITARHVSKVVSDMRDMYQRELKKWIPEAEFIKYHERPKSAPPVENGGAWVLVAHDGNSKGL